MSACECLKCDPFDGAPIACLAKGPCEFELQLLRSMAGLAPPMPWGAAVGAALEFLKGDGLVEQRCGTYSCTDKGLALVASRG